MDERNFQYSVQLLFYIVRRQKEQAGGVKTLGRGAPGELRQREPKTDRLLWYQPRNVEGGRSLRGKGGVEEKKRLFRGTGFMAA